MATVSKKEEDENILYDLLQPAEWVEDPEQVNNFSMQFLSLEELCFALLFLVCFLFFSVKPCDFLILVNLLPIVKVYSHCCISLSFVSSGGGSCVKKVFSLLHFFHPPGPRRGAGVFSRKRVFFLPFVLCSPISFSIFFLFVLFVNLLFCPLLCRCTCNVVVLANCWPRERRTQDERAKETFCLSPWPQTKLLALCGNGSQPPIFFPPVSLYTTVTFHSCAKLTFGPLTARFFP